MGVLLLRTCNSVLSVAITYTITSIILPGVGFLSGLLTLILYAAISFAVAAKFKYKTWIPIASTVVGFFWILIARLHPVTGFTFIINAALLGVCMYFVPKFLNGKSGKNKGSKSSSDLIQQTIDQFKYWVQPGRSSQEGSGGLPSQGIGVYGSPGAGLSKATKLFGASKVAAGVMGEQETSRILTNEFRNSKNPVALVNSIQFAGSKNADVDHALISGKKVFLIDSKKYRDGAYMATASNTVTVQSTDGVTRTKRVHMDSALENYRKILPSVKFPKAYVMIHSVGKVIPREIGGVYFGSPVQVVNDLKSEIGVGAENINRDVFNAINSRRK